MSSSSATRNPSPPAALAQLSSLPRLELLLSTTNLRGNCGQASGIRTIVDHAKRRTRNLDHRVAIRRQNTDRLWVFLFRHENIPATLPHRQPQGIQAGLVKFHRVVVTESPAGIGESCDLIR